MTEGQKMIWAAVWAAGYLKAIDFDAEPGLDIHDIHRIRVSRLALLAQNATNAVLGLDDVLEYLEFNHPPEYRTLKCVLEMLGLSSD